MGVFVVLFLKNVYTKMALILSCGIIFRNVMP